MEKRGRLDFRIALPAFATVLVGSLLAGHATNGEPPSAPRVHDERLEMTLIASEPEIVTPVGLAADSQGRLFVVESHTHARSGEYRGPKHDRIWVYQDDDGDGVVERSHLFADGLSKALAIAFAPNGDLYVIQMKSVVVLRDRDADGRSDGRDTVLTIRTDNNNNHGVFLALALDGQSRLYVSLGNIGGKAYSIEGTDGSTVAGKGDTGLIVRCGSDGRSVERFARGFWNPCDMKFDTFGRLLVTDNDPDSRGPNRVLHVIRGGDYGYQARYGSTGLHPYSAWNGELPGTLPMIAGVGEAPVGLLDCNRSSLPDDFRNDVIVGVWGTNEVVRVKTENRGASLHGTAEPLVTGDADFRPTAMAATADGSIYLADWADRRYPVHGKGRIWRLAAKSSKRRLTPTAPFAMVATSDGETDLRELQGADFETLVVAACAEDPFLAATAVTELARPRFRERLTEELDKSDASRRRVALLALRQAGFRFEATTLSRLLEDRDASIRQLAMIRIGETGREELAGVLRESLAEQCESVELFETFMATMAMIAPDHSQSRETSTPGSRVDRIVDQGLIREVLTGDEIPSHAKAMAVRYLTNPDDPPTVATLLDLALSKHRILAREAVRTVAGIDHADVADALAEIAFDESADIEFRCEAIGAYFSLENRDAGRLLSLAPHPHTSIAVAVIRGLAPHAKAGPIREKLLELLAQATAATVAAQARFALGENDPARPRNDREWLALASQASDPDAGRRVFFDARVSCAKCHRVHGRGGEIGPDMTHLAAAKTRQEIVASILHPSAERSPDYQGYAVVLDDGRILKGTQFHYRGDSAELLLDTGKRVRFRLDETEDYRPLATSLMPEDLIDSMSASEFRDLVGFLMTLQ